ncbi:polymorphic toxin-type HINT domain-containing protein [Deinococcus aquaedulcis]|uniref:polymorphic toxin-type HINT domain-containing protein n=1 Tax=Deinococcus aquaedulcis TaxID=2840455 RepID=UPI001C838490|nr:polymorphic toxin-type HINT domain-containing protein [Deinococcus aquaedulcis]
MITQVQAAASGQGRSNDLLSSDASYSYGEVQKSISYTRHELASISGQVVGANSLISEVRYVNGAPQRIYHTGLDVYGRVGTTNLYRNTDPTPYKTVNYGYSADGTNRWLVYPSNITVVSYDTGRTVKQYGDLPAWKTSNGVQTDYIYDEYGHVARESVHRSHVYAWEGSTAKVADRLHWKMYNGFGQPVWENLWEYQPETGASPQLISRQWHYYNSGELNASWDGTPDNMTDYRYADSGTNLGRVTEIVQGIGNWNYFGIATQRKHTRIGYDAYGRPNSTIVDGQFETKTKYDTLDRPVEVNEPNWSKTTTTRYGLTGKPWVESHYLNDGKTFNIIHHVDSLGREYQTDTPDGTVRTYYDAFDRPIKITDNRLTMNGGDADRSTYLKYDTAGNLIKKLSPVMTSAAGQPYTDARRPYEYYEYDVLDRQTAKAKLITGNAISPLNIEWPSNANATWVRTQYDAWDRPTLVTDQDGYQTKLTYDNSDNVVTTEQQVWTKNADAEPQYAQAHQGFDWVTTRMAHDGNARPLQAVDARGNSKRTQYNIFGTTAEIDERGITTKQYTYTPDGLQQATLEPDNEPGAVMVTTEYREYTTRQFPARIYRAHMHTQAGPGVGAVTDYVYDHAGRPVSTTLPPDASGTRATVTQSYHSSGQVKSATDANSFPTRMEYDWAGRLIAKHEDARPGNQTDANAGLSGGLHSTYAYDASGNLIKKDERGLITEYKYNSLGKVISESRPRVGEGTGTQWKLTTYRLDGLPTAKTSYNYQGNLASIPDVVDPWDSRISHSTGNMTMPWYYARGIQIGEVSWGEGHSWEYTKTTFVNGLGQQYFRKFWGNGGIYKIQQYANGAETGYTNYWSFKTFDQNGNVTSAWDTPTNADNNAPLDASLKQNSFSYQYSPSNKEIRQDRDIRVRQQSKVAGNNLTQYHGGNNGVYLAASVATTTTSYTERDQIEKSTTTDNVPYLSGNTVPRQDELGHVTTRHQRYSYFYDGRVWNSWSGDGVTDHGYKGVEAYDQRGRETVVYDSTGGRTNGAPGRVYTTYSTDGTVINRGEQNGAVTFTTTMTPTIGGLTGTSQGPTATSPTQFIYGQGTSDALQKDYVVSEGVGAAKVHNYDAYGNKTSTVRSTDSYQLYGASYNLNGEITQETKPDAWGNQMTQWYTLDSRGNRLNVSGGEAHGYIKRYDADDRVTQFHKLNTGNYCGTFGGCAGVANRYNDFRYDPYGQQVLSSTGQIAEQTNSNWYDEFQVDRDFNSVHAVQGQVQMTLRRAGLFMQDCGWNWGRYCHQLNTYNSNGTQLREATYSMLDGYNDDTSWSGTRPFAIVRMVTSLDAPTQSLSDTLKVNPLDVLTPSLPKLADPSKIGGGVTPKDEPAPVQTGADQDKKQTVSPEKPAKRTEAPKDQKQPEGAVLSLEVEANFNDGQGFEQPIYAVQPQESFGEFAQAFLRWAKDVSDRNAKNLELRDLSVGEHMDAVSEELQKKAVEIAKSSGWDPSIIQDITTVSDSFRDLDPADRMRMQTLLTYRIFDISKGSNADGYSPAVNQHFLTEQLPYMADRAKKADSMAPSALKAAIYDGIEANLLLEKSGKLDAATKVENIREQKTGMGKEMTVYGGVAAFIGEMLLADMWRMAVDSIDMNAPAGRFSSKSAPIPSGRQNGLVQVLNEAAGTITCGTRRFRNSFSASTLVQTLSGFVAISALTIGTPVLAFNEKTGENGYYPITDVISHGTKDQGVTHLTLSDPDNGHKLEFVETTPGHPFYVTERSDAQPRPKPEGHEELSEKWVGAGHLKIGDKIKQADGTIGLVANVINVQQTQEMFNLTVSEAHTYYVGKDSWLVHNASTGFDFKGVTSGSDVYNKGVHFKVESMKGFELRVKPTNDPTRVIFEAVFSGDRGTSAEAKAIRMAQGALANDPAFRSQLLDASQRVGSALNGIVASGGRNAAAAQKIQVENHFLQKSLGKIVDLLGGC